MMDFLQEIKAPNVVVAYHADCLDGLFAAWAVVENLRSRDQRVSYRTLAVRYGVDDPPLAEDTHLIVVDFAYTPQQLEVLPDGCFVTILDHHETAIKAWGGVTAGKRLLIESGRVVAYFDQTRSGAGLAFAAFVEPVHRLTGSVKTMRELVRAVEDRDLWKFEHADTRPLCRALKEITAASSLGDEAAVISATFRMQ